MKIILADLFHDNESVLNPDALPQNVPLGIGYLSTAIQQQFPESNVYLFRNIESLFREFHKASPLLIGFSLRSWNTDLTNKCLKHIESEYSNIDIVLGGPSVSKTDREQKILLNSYPQVSYVIAGEGESGIISLVHELTGGNKKVKPIPGVSFLNPEGDLVRGDTEEMPLEKIPSPYLEGVLDDHMEIGMVPLIQSMRGCPYQCTFCVSGCSQKEELRPFPLERVMAEINYIITHGNVSDMILTDENWGVLKERDVALAEFIINRFHETGKPSRLYYYTNKIVTAYSKQIINLVNPISWIGDFFLSYQTLNPDSRKAIHRRNSPLSELRNHVEWARKQGIQTVSEMIYGFPFETAETFITGVEKLLEEGIDKVVVFPLQLFPGIELWTETARERYGFVTRNRAADGGCGQYLDGSLFSLETEEIVVGTRWSNFEDFMTIRRFSFFLMMLIGREYALEFSKLCRAAGLNPMRLPRHFKDMHWKNHFSIKTILEEFENRAVQELHQTHRDVFISNVKKIRSGDDIGALKLNLIYMGKILSKTDTVDAILYGIAKFIETRTEVNHLTELLDCYVQEILPQRIYCLNGGTSRGIEFESRFDYIKWSNGEYKDLSELLSDDPIAYTASIEKNAYDRVRRLVPENEQQIQRFFDQTPTKCLLRQIKGVK